jgi:hypothetical protein
MLEPPHFINSFLYVFRSDIRGITCAIGTDRVTDKSLERKMGEVLSAQGKEMSEIKSNIVALSTQMAAIMEEVKKTRSVPIAHILASPP